MTDGETVLVQKTMVAAESLQPNVHTTSSDLTANAVRKIDCFIEIVHDAEDGGLVLVCPGCSVNKYTGSSRSSNLKKHILSSCDAIRKRPEYWPLCCPHCLRPFTRLDNLKKHVSKSCKKRSEHPPVDCSLCGDTFARRDILNQHVKRKHPPSP